MSFESWYTKDATLDDMLQCNGYVFTIKDTICTKNNKNIESTNITNVLPLSLSLSPVLFKIVIYYPTKKILKAISNLIPLIFRCTL